MENLNLVELLRDCPKGMELDCTVYDKVTLHSVYNNEGIIFPILVLREDGNGLTLTKYGQLTNASFAKCVIFPKGKTTWEGFHRPFEDGDILATNDGAFIAIVKKNGGKYYCCCHTNGAYFVIDGSGWFDRLATEEEKQKLFDAIKDNGYKWNAETKTLEKLKTFKFDLNSIIRLKGTDTRYRVKQQEVTRIKGFVEYKYKLRNIIDNSTKIVYDVDEDNYELAPNKFDITTLKPFESRVLVRDTDTDAWKGAFYSHYKSKKFYTIGSSYYYQCIPYEVNKQLLDTTNDCDDFYKTWEK